MEAETIKVCPTCEVGHLYKDVRDVTVKRQKLGAKVKAIVGAFCEHCDEIEFDETTDSAQRYAMAGDELVLQNRATAAGPVEDAAQNAKTHPESRMI